MNTTKKRLEPTLPKDHDDHRAERGYNSISHWNLVHKFVPMPQAMKIPDAKASTGWGMEEAQKTSLAWQLDKVGSQKEVILEAQSDKKKVHFAILMDICHLKNAQWEPIYQKNKGRVVLRGDIVRDDSGAYAITLLNKVRLRLKRQQWK